MNPALNIRGPFSAKKDRLAVLSLMFGCLALVLGPISGIPAIICGHMAKRRRRTRPELAGDGDATAGLLTGYVFSVLGVIAFAYYRQIVGLH